MTIIFVSIILLALAFLLFSKESSLSRHREQLILRLVIIISIGLILISHKLKITTLERPKIPLLVLVDHSRSIDYQNNLVHIDSILNRINQLPYRKKIFMFSDSLRIFSKEKFKWGEKTDIAQAILAAQHQKPGAIVLISDGQHNQKTDVFTAVRQSKSPIYTIGISIDTIKDVVIQNIIKPSHTFSKETTSVSILIYNHSLYNHPLKINLLWRNNLLSSQMITLPNQDALQEIKFNIIPETTGQITYTVIVDSLPEETNYGNNRKDFTLQVFKDRFQVLYLTNGPSFNTRFLLNSLKNPTSEKLQNNFIVHPIIALTNQKYTILSDQSLEQLFNNPDVIILDNIDEFNLTPDIIRRLQNLITKGKGFLIFGGDNFRAHTLLNEILPLQYNSSKNLSENIFFQLSNDGQKIPIFFDQANQYLLNNVPPLWGINLADNIKPNATVWLEAVNNKIPIMSYLKYQKNKTIFFSGFPFWRLAFSNIETESQRKNFDQFLTNVLRFLALTDLDNFQLLTDKSDYLIGEKIIINLFATTPDGRPYTDLNVYLDAANLKTNLPLQETQAGIYQTEIEAFQSGALPLTAQIYQDTQFINTVTTQVNISPQTIEDIKGVNQELLQKIAILSNGQYFSVYDFLQQG
ncbi:MAG: hypothetical protein ABIK31_02245, partial [candidate division WOR-3 bacterium]